MQQNEIDQIRALGSFLDNELSYAEQYTQILRDVKDNWPGMCVLLGFFTSPNLTDNATDKKLRS
jgi:hypothetical protein